MSYEFVGLLGRGGSAVVELALDSEGRRVATKRLVLTGSESQMRVARQRLRREAEILSSLAHPGIVPILDVIDDGSEVILVFPVLAENLEDRVERLGPLPPSELVRIGRVLIEALAVAHRHGVVHRDIKPANVLFDDAGEPALADFGVALTREATAGLTQAGTVIGTPMWMAPEQARGEPVGPASDVFSLGATLSFAATGQPPHPPGPATVIIDRVARDRIRPVPEAVPDSLRLVLAQMLDARPERRPSAACVLGGLDGTNVAPAPPANRESGAAHLGPILSRGSRRMARGLSHGLVRLLGDPPPRPLRRSRRRRRTALAAGVVGTIVLGLVVVAIATGTNGPGALGSGATAARCTPLPYLSCGSSGPAANTNGDSCNPGWYDLDGLATDGCEARSDYVAGTALTQHVALRANLVPASALDSYTTHVSGDALHLCWGSLHITLTAPAHTAEQLTVWKGATKVAGALSADGTAATATVHKPSCFASDGEDLRVTVAAVAVTGGASATDFTLTRNGGW